MQLILYAHPPQYLKPYNQPLFWWGQRGSWCVWNNEKSEAGVPEFLLFLPLSVQLRLAAILTIDVGISHEYLSFLLALVQNETTFGGSPRMIQPLPLHPLLLKGSLAHIQCALRRTADPFSEDGEVIARFYRFGPPRREFYLEQNILEYVTSAGKRGALTNCLGLSAWTWLLMQVDGIKLFLLTTLTLCYSLGTHSACDLMSFYRNDCEEDFLLGARCRTENLIFAILRVRRRA